MADDCPFCSIVDGDIPSYDVYETEEVLAFLDVNPVAEGHTLVIPKAHAETLTDLDREETADLFAAVQQVAAGVDEAL
ncbi:MAG: HIT family protein, partial [Candidatus Nanohaloarchaea archaeon]